MELVYLNSLIWHMWERHSYDAYMDLRGGPGVRGLETRPERLAPCHFCTYGIRYIMTVEPWYAVKGVR